MLTFPFGTVVTGFGEGALGGVYLAKGRDIDVALTAASVDGEDEFLEFVGFLAATAAWMVGRRGDVGVNAVQRDLHHM